MGTSLKEKYGTQIKLWEIAKDAGYIQDRDAGEKAWIVMKKPESGDHIIISRKNNWFRSNVTGHEGHVIDFVKAHLSEFPYRTTYTGIRDDAAFWEAVAICDHFLSNGAINKSGQGGEEIQVRQFTLDDYNVTRQPSYERMPYLTGIRKIHDRNLQKFCNIGAIWRVTDKREDERLKRENEKDDGKRYQRTKYAFPCTVPGQEEVKSMEMKLHYKIYDAESGQHVFRSYTAMPEGGDKSHTLWMAVFSKNKVESQDPMLCRDENLQTVKAYTYPDVKEVYVCEAAIDAISLTEVLKLHEKGTDFAVCSCGGTMMQGGISRLPQVFPNATFCCATDNDVRGKIYDIQMAHFLRNEGCVVNHIKATNEVRIRARGQESVIPADQLNPAVYVARQKLEMRIVKPDPRFKDWNEMLQYSKMDKTEKKVYARVDPARKGYYRNLTPAERAVEFSPARMLPSQEAAKGPSEREM